MEDKKTFSPLLTDEEEFALSRELMLKKKINVNTLIIIIVQTAILLVVLFANTSFNKQNSDIKELEMKVRELELQVKKAEATNSFQEEL